jgi:hypothetical protein
MSQASDDTERPRDLERELLDDYPQLAQLLRWTAELDAWQPSAVGEAVLRRLAGAVAVVLAARLAPAEADTYLAEVVAETQAWLNERRRAFGLTGERPTPDP